MSANSSAYSRRKAINSISAKPGGMFGSGVGSGVGAGGGGGAGAGAGSASASGSSASSSYCTCKGTTVYEDGETASENQTILEAFVPVAARRALLRPARPAWWSHPRSLALCHTQCLALPRPSAMGPTRRQDPIYDTADACLRTCSTRASSTSRRILNNARLPCQMRRFNLSAYWKHPLKCVHGRP
jgi:hypothetical protein